MVELMIDEESPIQTDAEIKDTNKKALKLAILGCGQGGGNIADAFWAAGYRRVAAVNTTARDMQRLQLPEKNRHILKSPGGAGKDPSVGRGLVEAESEEIHRLMLNAFGKDVDQILLCAGSGGGTGTGGVLPLVDIAKQYMISVVGVDPAIVSKRVGVVVTLPTKDESSAVQKNALDVLKPLLSLAESGKISPLVLVDNARVMSLYGKASVTDVWGKANRNIAALFDSFNQLVAQDDQSVVVTCDPQDYRTVLEAGILAFGRTKLEAVDQPTAVADAVRENVKKGLLVEGMDLSKATHGAAILVGDEAALGTVPQESLEAAFASLNRLMHQGPETKLHRGVYAIPGSGLYVYTILAGLGRPESRLREMEAKATGAKLA